MTNEYLVITDTFENGFTEEKKFKVSDLVEEYGSVDKFIQIHRPYISLTAKLKMISE